MRILSLLLLSMFAVLAIAQPPAPDFTRKMPLNIPSQPLDQALLQFGGLTGLAVMFNPTTGADKIKSKRLRGSFKPEDALRKLLRSTGLQWERMGDSGILVRRQEKVEPPPKQEESAPPNVMEQVLITGSHIAGAPPDVSSVIVYPRERIEQSGALTTDQFVRDLPQNFSLLNASTSIGASINPQVGQNVGRGAAIDLSGLGTGATLVLINGQRLAPGGYDGSFIDVSMIPLAAVERVEVLPDSASAIYGSDAVAGVVNFVMRSDYDGLETTPYYQDVTGGGGRERGLSQLAGKVWSTGGFMVAYQNDQQQAVDASSRDTLTHESGAYQVVPLQSMQNAMVTLHQTLYGKTLLSADGFYTERTSSQDYLSDPLISTQSHGRAKMLGGSLAVGQELPGQWRTDVVGGYSQEGENVRTSAALTEQFYQTRATLASIDWRASGPVLAAPGGRVTLSVGSSYRGESFNNYVAPDLRRNVVGAYAEAFVPIVGTLNALPWARRIELSLAIRRDVYHIDEPGVANVGSNNPKIAALWNPLTALILRGTFSTSFRAAPPAQMDPSSDIALLLPFSSPSGPGTSINTLYLTGGNSHLRPEVAKTFTAGFELKPITLPDSSLSATYFHVRYTDRIAAPPVLGLVTSAFSQLGTLSPYINSTPSATDIQAVYDHFVVLDPTGIGRGGVQAIFNSTLQNIASTQASGVELTLTSKVKTGYGDFSFIGQGQYLAQLRNQAAPTTSRVSVVGTVFNPPNLRMQAGIDWSYNAWTISMMSDYTSSFRDTLIAGAPNVASWLTLNGGVTYTARSRFAVTPHGSTTFVLSIHNLADRPAPYVKGLSTQTLGYDPTNASVLGRAILFEIRQRW